MFEINVTGYRGIIYAIPIFFDIAMISKKFIKLFFKSNVFRFIEHDQSFHYVRINSFRFLFRIL